MPVAEPGPGACTACGATLHRSDGSWTVCVRCALGFAVGEWAETFPKTPRDTTVSGTPPVERIGPYRLIRSLGEGGMGTVWEAEQERPIHRLVALKRLRLGLDGSQVLARFESERQALALMNHPNVAHALDAGQTEDGHPYFAMELVDGPWITSYCDAERLDTRRRLALFIDVCRAIQHAHQKGVVHRDIKPSNILVQTEGGRAVPKVIDFGVAKALGAHLTDRTLMTQVGQRVGTPEYMSPEQAGPGGFDVDTRTDVYSLGTLLYELLTGSLPFAAPNGDIDELRRRIREDEPVPPSVRVATSGPAAAEIARARAAPPLSLSKSLRGELDCIVLKALEKDRSRRYRSPDELADDVGRYLNNEPVDARAPSVGYRALKFFRRHRGAVAAAASITLVLIAGAATSAVLYFRSEESRAEASAVADFLGGLITDVNPSGGNKDVTVREVVDRASDSVSVRFKSQPLVEAYLHDVMARSYSGLGAWEQARTHAEAAFRLRHDMLGADDPLTLQSMVAVGAARIGTGRLAETGGLLDEAILRSRKTLGDEAPITLRAMAEKAITLLYQGKLAEGEALHRSVYDVRRRVLGDDDPETLESSYWLAQCAIRQGRAAEAESRLRDLLERQRRVLGTEHPRTLSTTNLLGWALNTQGKHQEAEDVFVHLLETRRRVLGDRHPETLQVVYNLGGVRATMGDKRKAFEWLRNAVDHGYCNLPNLTNDHDLDSLRGTTEFDQLIADANANFARQFGSLGSHSR